MRTEDEMDAEIAKIFDEVTVTPTGQDGKPELGFTAACEEFRKAHKRFLHWDAHPDKHVCRWTRMEWWAALNRLSEAEQRVKGIFLGTGEPTLRCRMQYAQFRQFYLEGKSLAPNA